MIDCVTDEEIIHAYRLMAKTEGILAEPASAASVAGLLKSINAGKIGKDGQVVCVLTGNGLKDPDSAIRYSGCEVKKTSSNFDDIVRTMGL
jgi:threonine synthase